MKLTKSFTFDAAHMLDTHDGKCKNLHGHTYRLEVTVQGDLIASGAKAGMVIDFADLKSQVKTCVLEQLDHAFIYDATNPQETQLAQLLQSWGRKVFALPARTTAEHLSLWIYRTLSPLMSVYCIRLYETPNSFCECSGDDV